MTEKELWFTNVCSSAFALVILAMSSVILGDFKIALGSTGLVVFLGTFSFSIGFWLSGFGFRRSLQIGLVGITTAVIIYILSVLMTVESNMTVQDAIGVLLSIGFFSGLTVATSKEPKYSMVEILTYFFLAIPFLGVFVGLILFLTGKMRMFNRTPKRS